MQDDKLFYIVGVGRSGTTLLMSMLNAHPDIGTPPETHFVTTHVLGRHTASLEDCREMLVSDHRFARLGIDVDSVLSTFAATGAPVPMTSLYLRILSIWKDRNHVRIVGDKAPRYVECLPVLHRISPGARVLHLIRDPRAVFLSRTKAAWSADRRAWRHLLAYAVQYEEGRTRGPACFGENYKEIYYEELISAPEAVLSDVCSFLGVEYSPAMLQFSDSAAEIISDDEWSWKREASGPLLRENAEKWRDELSSSQIGTVEAACRRPFVDGIYRHSGASPHTTGRLTGVAVRVLSRLYRIGLRLRLWRWLRAGE